MEVALKLAEANEGELRTCWGIMPLNIEVKRDFYEWPKANDEWLKGNLTRVKVDYDFRWGIDEAYWQHCVERFTAKYPRTMNGIAAEVETYLNRKKAAS